MYYSVYDYVEHAYTKELKVNLPEEFDQKILSYRCGASDDEAWCLSFTQVGMDDYSCNYDNGISGFGKKDDSGQGEFWVPLTYPPAAIRSVKFYYWPDENSSVATPTLFDDYDCSGHSGLITS
jgi:hypothetical protein